MIRFEYQYEQEEAAPVISYSIRDSDEMTWMEILTHATKFCEAIGYTLSIEKLEKWASKQDELRGM